MVETDVDVVQARVQGTAAPGEGGNARPSFGGNHAIVPTVRPTTSSGSSFRSNAAKQRAFEEVKRRLEANGQLTPELAEALRLHIRSLPTRYSQDINTDSDDILAHYRLLEDARKEPGSLKVAARAVQVVARHNDVAGESPSSPGCGVLNESFGHALEREQQGSLGDRGKRPAFGSSPSLERLALESWKGSQGSLRKAGMLNDDFSAHSQGAPVGVETPVDDARMAMADDSSRGHEREHESAVIELFEVTVASTDQPKLLSRITTVMGNLGLNIREAHVFSAKDGYTLDVFVIDSWAGGPPEALAETLVALFVDELMVTDNIDENVANMKQPAQGFHLPNPLVTGGANAGSGSAPEGSAVWSDWELDPGKLTFESKVASGSFGDMYRGHYNSQEVAIKILRNATDDPKRLNEFMQEVAIMRKVRHKSVVQFIGACTRPPNLCIVFVFMHGGSVYDYIHRQGGSFTTRRLLRVASDIASGMDYLHRSSIVHRDLKSANLLMDEHGDVKIGDFGVARVVDPIGVMTAETGTYRWMAPEVIEHSPYTPKCDVYSYGIMIWELLTRSVPYAEQTPLQAAVGVVQNGLRPPIPADCPESLRQILELTWRRNAEERPSFAELREMLQRAAYEEEAREQMRAQGSSAQAQPAAGNSGGAGFFARLRGAGR